MTAVTTESPPTLVLSRDCPYAPPAEHVRLAQRAPISRVRLPGGQVVWALTRLEHIRAVLTDARFSSDRSRLGFPTLFTGQRLEADAFPAPLTSMDPPEHGPARRAVVGEFTVKRIAALRGGIQQIVDDHIDAMLAGPRPVDVVAALALPVPSLVICELLGVPYADHEFFQSRSSRLLRRDDGAEARDRARDELHGYLDRLLTAKEHNPTDDLLGRRILAQRRDGHVDHDGLVTLAMLLLIAGHESTANMISLGIMTLLDRPDLVATIRGDSRTTPALVEELLRYFTIAELAIARLATEDAEIGGVLIRADDGVLPLSHTAHRDPEAFDHPNELDIDRGARHHIAFGFGAHQCLGQNLARLELQIVLDTVFERIPDLRAVTPIAQLEFKTDALVYGPRQLLVTW